MDIFVPHVRSYYHFVTESLVSLFSLMEKHNEYNPTLWYRSNEYHTVLRYFTNKPFNKGEVLPEKCLYVQRKFISKPSEFKVLHKLKSFIETKVPPAKMEDQVVIIKRLYYRSLGNFDEMVTAVRQVSKLPVRVAFFEQMSFTQQVQLMQHTRLLIGSHGAGLTNAIFMPAGAGMLEIMPLAFYLTWFDCLCEGMGYKHLQVEAEHLGKLVRYVHLLEPFPCPRCAHFERIYGNGMIYDGARDQVNFPAPIDRIVEHVKEFFK